MRILEANVDDIGLGGVYSLVRSFIINHKSADSIDIAAYEPFESAEHIAELERYGSRVFFVGHVGNKILKQFFLVRNMFRLVSHGNYDCVHVHGDVANKLLVLALAARMAGCPRVVLHSHASSVDGSRRWLKKLSHFTCRIFLPLFATDYMSCSSLATQWMFPFVARERVFMLNNGVDLERFAYSESIRAQVRARLALDGKLIIGHVGRFAYQKNHDFLIRAFAAVASARRDAVLLLVGDGDLQESVRQRVCSLGLDSRVVFYGVSSNVSELFQAMDVFVLPSHFEGLPIVGVEAQAAGLPVVFSDQITTEARLTPNVSFLPIDDNSAYLWAEEILRFASLSRSDNSLTLDKSGFSISSTVSALDKFYHR